MKNNFFLTVSFLMYSLVFSQSNSNTGIIVEYNELLEVKYEIYNPPLKILQVKSQSQIDYSNIKGLIQSFYSASNLEWALSDYLNENPTTARDEEHFNAVLNTDFDKNYIQIETIYNFEINNRQFAFIKYSFIMDEIPFPIIGIMSAEKNNGRWYINNLLNQNDILAYLSTFDQSVINGFFSKENKNAKLNEIGRKFINEQGYFDLTLVTKNYSELLADSDIKKLVKDKRLLDPNLPFKNASFNSNPKIYHYEVIHPFILQKSMFSEYTSKEKNLVNDEKTLKRFQNEPESLLLSTEPIDLIHKFYFSKDNQKYFIIKYNDGNANRVKTFVKKRDNFTLVEDDIFKKWENLFLKIRSSFFVEISKEKSTETRIQKIKNEVKSISTGVNLDLLSEYIKENKNALSKYLDE